jgi:hypothetical protein
MKVRSESMQMRAHGSASGLTLHRLLRDSLGSFAASLYVSESPKLIDSL